ncbi:hypothetical protein C8N46_105259 [Kordia periserrulae]|uniref:Uncharacterized protein n=1 Tax=Kordia periserrulae TaxID=701523 RepID=A0A2T6BYF5_9FLAO|nr:hypothetical protein [Kordia periserrulae]PTX61103.1 hypothetical protein C8N46_105259 [Kordia periserrulae]
MGILSDTLKIIKEKVESKQVKLSSQLLNEVEEYVVNKSTDKSIGFEIVKKILDEIFEYKDKEIQLAKLANKTDHDAVQSFEKLKAILKSEKKPFQKDKSKYFIQYSFFLILAILSIILLVYLLTLPILNKNLLPENTSGQIMYRISLIVPFSTIIALLIYQYMNALKHYHKACESIHIMGSYPAIIKAICSNEKQKQKASERLFDILFDWQPRPRGWKLNKASKHKKRKKKNK